MYLFIQEATLTEALNPIDVIEEFVLSQDWPYHRISINVLDCNVNGQWCDYRLHFLWYDEEKILQIFLLYEMVIPKGKKTKIACLMDLLNHQLHIGNFETYMSESCPAFRHGILLHRGHPPSEELIIEIIEYAIDMLEKYYPAFHFVILGERTPQEAASMVMIDTVGEA